MPKRKAGHLSNLGGYATINTKRTKVRKTQKEEKENLNVASLGWATQIVASTNICATALQDLRNILKPCWDTGRGYKDPALDNWTKGRLESMVTFLMHYTNPSSPGYEAWMAASLLTANGKGMLSWWARDLREATKAYINNRINLPINPYGTWTISRLTDDLANEIHEHLQSIGAYYLDREEVKMRLKLKKTISLSTAKHWMKLMDYCWVRNHRGQYVDGHERDNVVDYHQNIFLRKWAAEEGKMRSWGTNLEEICSAERPLCVWFHDESTFYANDRRKSRWVHKNTSTTPYAKGEGASLMVADFISADHGWLQSPDGKESAWVLFKAGKSRDGYFSNEEILTQCQKAMDIVQASWPNEDHMFMPKGIPRNGTNWGVEVTTRNSVGKIIYGANGKPSKTKIRMANGTLQDGSAQPLYFPEGHAHEGVFKGMAAILEERGYGDMSKVRAECKPNFTCKPGIPNSDFVNVKSTLELACDARSIRILFLPKFHCELNFIEQRWGHANEGDLEKNLIDALDSVTVEQMQKYAWRSHRFMNAYQKGLMGKQAAWATKKYCGHRVLPNSVLAELKIAGI
ncbi:hypothetical protein BDR06DRAFT_992017 [Suillus hirtellus]|nr:hypothetical protein BDR06DRAFT_992017 [Suillus hirtellus]